jgi:hypothetical protein
VNPLTAWWASWLTVSYFWWGAWFVPPPSRHLEEERLVKAFRQQLNALPTGKETNGES